MMLLPALRSDSAEGFDEDHREDDNPTAERCWLRLGTAREDEDVCSLVTVLIEVDGRVVEGIIVKALLATKRVASKVSLRKNLD
jgi:hypothetical protein